MRNTPKNRAAARKKDRQRFTITIPMDPVADYLEDVQSPRFSWGNFVMGSISGFLPLAIYTILSRG